MHAQRWNMVLSRIVPQDADDFDEIAGRFDPARDPVGKDLFPEVEAALTPSPGVERVDEVCIGLRARGPADAAEQAMRLAAFALERDVEVVVLDGDGDSGLERFGFRVERVAGEDEARRAACETQIRRFWNIDLVL